MFTNTIKLGLSHKRALELSVNTFDDFDNSFGFLPQEIESYSFLTASSIESVIIDSKGI